MPRRVAVTVVIDDDTGQKAVRLLSDPTSGGLPIVQDHVLQFNNNQNGQYSDGFVVDFHLPADQGRNGSWCFADTPIWVKLADQKGACPRTVSDHDPNILTNPTVTNNGRTLTVTYSNLVKQYFGFALRFESTSGGQTWGFDPIGDGQNGGKPVSSSSYATIAVGTLVFAAFAAYGFGLFGETHLAPSMEYIAVAVGTLCFAAFAAYLSGLFERSAGRA